MNTEIVKEFWTELGAIGFLVVGLTIAVCYLVKRGDKMLVEHKSERDEWRREAQSQTDKMVDVVKANTTAITELCVLVKSRK